MNDSMKPRQRVFFAGAFPPPVGGQASINARVLAEASAWCDALPLDLSAGKLDRDLRYHAARAFKNLAALIKIVRHRPSVKKLYLSLDSGMGLFYNLLLIALARVLRMKVVLHHHSFRYIGSYSRVMKIVWRISRSDCCHVFLCRCMSAEYQALYGKTAKVIISSNARHMQAFGTAFTRRAPRPALTFGLMSHLSNEKGLDDFIALVRRCAGEAMPVKAILAGPPVSRDDQRRIDRAAAELGGLLEFRGPVYGEAKEAFFADIDVFVFPTRFRVEAQPLVLLEAMSHGLPVISFARGCIAQDLAGGQAVVIGAEREFVEPALAQLRIWKADAGLYRSASDSSAQTFERLREASMSGFADLLEEIT
jgi:glycosyltransferase involved in cell wall biosynthesis